MSTENGASSRRRGFRFRRNKHGDTEQAQSFDDDSLGMGSGSGEKQLSRGRFRMRRSKDDSAYRGRPTVITTTTRTRSRSADELSFDFDGGSGMPSQSSSAPKKSGFFRRLGSKGKKSKNHVEPAAMTGSAEPMEDVSDRPVYQPQRIQHAESFDSDNMLGHVREDEDGDDMLKHVRISDPGVSYKRRNRTNGRARFSDPILADGGITIHTDTNDEGDGQAGSPDPPVKRISFDDSVTPLEDQETVRTDYSASMMPGRGSNDGSFVSQGSTGTTHTYRSMGGMDVTSQRAVYSSQEGRSRANRKKFRVRPYHAFHEPVHMTEEEIYNDSTKPSLDCEMLQSYLAPSSRSHKRQPVPEDIIEKYGTPVEDGRIGSLRCEVLGCVSLARRSNPDVCVYLVAGDCAFATDVIQGYRSPMWPSASRRAAVFPIHHAYTRLYAGVFDVRVRKKKETDVFCGRVCVDIASLRPNTEYDITFPLRASAFVYDKQKRGVLRLRFSLHWFSERGAVLSYFSSPRTLDKSSPLVQGSPTIPCADPKTFRNVAVTVHGNDLPGKYSRSAFKATVREFQLYQLNLRFMLKYLVIDAVMYEKPYISLYLFFAGMHCVVTESVSKVPPYFVGFLIILYLENYKHYVADTIHNEGYQQLTLLEVFKALVSKTGSEERYFEPILVTKRAKKRGNRRNPRTLRRIQADSPGGAVNGDEDTNIPLDHKEFPFSDRQAYPKFTVENALAPGSSRNAGGGNTRLHGRLSVYYAPTPDADQGGGTNDSGEDEEDESSDESAGDETIVEGTQIFDEAFDLDDDDNDDGVITEARNNQYGYGEASPYGYGDDNAGSSRDPHTKIRRIIHSAQNIDDAGGAAVPPQITVKRVENMFHKHSYSLAVERVVAPPTKEHVQSAMSNASNSDNEKLALTTEEIEKEIEKKRKAYLDEFDKLLGLNAKASNPISRMFATFLGPLMRVLRIPIFMLRISFNAASWRDPYLSFWVFCFLCLTLLLLMAFPWRLFFFLATLIGLGPQNIFLRKYLEKRAKKREEEEMEKQETGSVSDSVHSFVSRDNTLASTRRQRSDDTDNMSTKSEHRRGFFGFKKNRVKMVSATDASDFFVEQDRPPFSPDIYGPTNRRLRPRSVVIPYSRLRKERFYDWPPDPTVSRATPQELETWGQDQLPPEILGTKSSEEPAPKHRRRLSAGGTSTALRTKYSEETKLRRRRGSL